VFLRFASTDLDERTGQPTGLLTVAYRILRDYSLTPAEADELREHVAWLEQHVPIPDRFARKRNVSHKETHGIAWAKASAGDMVMRMRAIAGIAARHEIHVDVVKTDRPGYVVYEDAWQVVAEPFHGEGR
jgi:hypothetical protein